MRKFLPAFLVAAALSLVPASLSAGIPSKFHDFAQIADGGGFRTIFLIMNQNSAMVTVSLEFFDDNGNSISLTLDGLTANKFIFTVPARGSKKMVSPGIAETSKTGWARLEADADVGAQVLFESINGQQLISQAAVESIGPVDYFDLFVDETSNSNTGLAIANLSESGTVLVRMTFLDSSGNVIGTKDITLPILGHTATFVFQQIPDALGKKGTLRVQCSGTVAVVALQLTGPVLGTLPPVVVFL